MQALFGDTGVQYIGTRHGEKLYETLMTSEERVKAIDMGRYFRIPRDERNLNYEKYFSTGDDAVRTAVPYTSSNTEQLDVDGVKEKLLSVDYVQKELERWGKA